MKEHNEDKTLPPVDSTETQRFTAIKLDPEQTDPHMVVRPFPKSAPQTPERPPERDVIYENGGTQLSHVEEFPNGDIAGTDGNGIRFVIPKAEVGEWRKTK